MFENGLSEKEVRDGGMEQQKVETENKISLYQADRVFRTTSSMRVLYGLMRVVACVAFICALVLASCHQKITAEVEAGYQECRMALLLGNIYIALEEGGNTSQDLLVEMMKNLVKPFGLPVNESTSVSSGEDGVGVRVSSSLMPDVDKLYKVTDFVEPVLVRSMCLFIALFLTQMVLRIGNCITMANRYRYGKSAGEEDVE